MLRTTLQYTLFVAAVAAPLCFAARAEAEPRTHDGLYLSLDTGLGYLSSKADVAGYLPKGAFAGAGTSVKYYGLFVPFEVLVGGTVGPVAIGGGFLWDPVFSLRRSEETPAGTSSGTDSGVTLHLFAIHAFADIYPDVHGGFHVRPFVGYAGLLMAPCDSCTSNGLGGPIFGAGVGYDFWVADEWSIGVMGRFAYAALKPNDVSYSTIDPALLVTFTFN